MNANTSKGAGTTRPINGENDVNQQGETKKDPGHPVSEPQGKIHATRDSLYPRRRDSRGDTKGRSKKNKHWPGVNPKGKLNKQCQRVHTGRMNQGTGPENKAPGAKGTAIKSRVRAPFAIETGHRGRDLQAPRTLSIQRPRTSAGPRTQAKKGGRAGKARRVVKPQNGGQSRLARVTRGSGQTNLKSITRDPPDKRKDKKETE